MWLKDGKGNLYKKYKEECVKEGRKPISESKFRDGLNAGNFKEMVRMTGLCNICDDVGAKNWDRFFELTEMLRKETCGETPSTDTMDTLEEDELDDENVDKTKVTIIDITDEDDEYKQHNSLPADSPVLMIEVNEHVSNLHDFEKRCKTLKGHLLSKFLSNLQPHSSCPFHCVDLLLNEIENYWSVKPLYHGLWAIEIISRFRYKPLMAFLNMVDPVTEDYSNKLHQPTTVPAITEYRC
jgi:hypothetical protein